MTSPPRPDLAPTSPRRGPIPTSPPRPTSLIGEVGETGGEGDQRSTHLALAPRVGVVRSLAAATVALHAACVVAICVSLR